MIIEDGVIRYAIEDKLANKLDIMIDRCTRPKQKQNAYLGNHGKTGEGKTNSSLVEAHYVKLKTKRPIHLFFRLEPMINFAKNTHGQLIIHDEPALDSLSTDQMTTLNKDYLRLINTARKKRHFTIINITKFWRFSQDLIVDTLLGLVNMYTRRGVPGRFNYIRQRKLEILWNDHARFNKKSFNKLKAFGGKMPEIMEKYFKELDITIHGNDGIVEHATLDDYERLKDESIKSIGEVKSKRQMRAEKQLSDLKGRISRLWKYKLISAKEVAKIFNLPLNTVRRWGELDEKRVELDEKEPISQEKQVFRPSVGATIVNSMVNRHRQAPIIIEQDLPAQNYYENNLSGQPNN